MSLMYNSISTPHSHGIVVDGNYLIIEWDGKEPEGGVSINTRIKK